MVGVDLVAFKEKFSNWEIINTIPEIIRLVSSIEDNEQEIPQIIAYLYECSPENDFSITIKGSVIEVQKNKKVKYSRIYTSGCFDVFHYGHLNILIKSKELCDYLIVGVSTDELIEKEKGRKPVIPFLERIKVVQALGIVDEVIAQEDKDKQKIVDTYKIDAISVGDDWKGRYPKVSCEMEYFPYTANVSSTILKEALKLV